MTHWLRENWFKLGGLMCALIFAGSVGYYFIVFLPQIEQGKLLIEQSKIAKDLAEAENRAMIEARKVQMQEDAQQAAFEEKQNSIQKANLEQQQNDQMEAVINKCITNAYTELKTLQGNFDWMYFTACAKSSDAVGCDHDWNEKNKNDAFTTYQNEWVPQCKLGKRVFIHYEPYKY